MGSTQSTKNTAWKKLIGRTFETTPYDVGS